MLMDTQHRDSGRELDPRLELQEMHNNVVEHRLALVLRCWCKMHHVALQQQQRAPIRVIDVVTTSLTTGVELCPAEYMLF